MRKIKCDEKIKVDGVWECSRRRKIISGLYGCICNKENCHKLKQVSCGQWIHGSCKPVKCDWLNGHSGQSHWPSTPSSVNCYIPAEESNMSGTDYFKNHGRELECPICTRRFPAIYHTKEMQRPKKIYGTKTLMSLWAYYNFLRHLKSHDESRLEVIEDEVTEKTEPKKGGPRREGNKVIEG